MDDQVEALDEADERAEEKRLATEGVPLAAIFKTRRGGRRRGATGDRSVAEANARRHLDTEDGAEGDYDVVLTDAYAVAEEVASSRRADPEGEAAELLRALQDHAADATFALGSAVLDEEDDAPVAVRAAVTSAPPGPLAASFSDDQPEDTLDMPAEAQIPAELLNTADDLARLRDLLPPEADLAWAQEAVLMLAATDATRFRTPTRGAWFVDLFGEEFLLSQPLRSDATVRQEVAFIADQLEVRAGQDVLDLACGTGRHARTFARAGCRVTAVDLSLPLLRRGVEAARREGSDVHFMQADMRDLVFDHAFDAAWMLDTSFGYFSEVENLMVLRNLWRALRPGGRLLVDVINRDYVIADLPTRNWWEGDGCLVQEDIEFAHATSRLEIRRYLVFADGRERMYDISIRLYSAHELERMIVHAGLEVENVSGSLHTAGAFFGMGSERILIAARRPL